MPVPGWRRCRRAWLRSLQTGLGDIQAMHTSDEQGHGPAVSGVDAPAATQDEANDLLAALGI